MLSFMTHVIYSSSIQPSVHQVISICVWGCWASIQHLKANKSLAVEQKRNFLTVLKCSVISQYESPEHKTAQIVTFVISPFFFYKLEHCDQVLALSNYLQKSDLPLLTINLDISAFLWLTVLPPHNISFFPNGYFLVCSSAVHVLWFVLVLCDKCYVFYAVFVLIFISHLACYRS